MACEKAHKRILGPFFRALLATQVATRSNSLRTRLLEILHSTICYHSREQIREKTYCLDSLRSTSPFDEDLRNFHGRVANVIAALPLNATIAEKISAGVAEAGILRAIEKLEDALRAVLAKKRFNDALTQFARVVAITSR